MTDLKLNQKISELNENIRNADKSSTDLAKALNSSLFTVSVSQLLEYPSR